jgi:methylated-DNA-[protein]-cysteine S-methyltransferase
MVQNAIFYTVMNSPVGELTIASTNKGLCRISFGSREGQLVTLQDWGKRWMLCQHIIPKRTAILDETIQQLEQYFAGSRQAFDIPLDICGTSFQKLVWQLLRGISYGQVATYRDIAVSLGASKAVRAVGGANNKNPVPIIIPCHRIVGSNGTLVGYAGGLNIKEYLLNLEASFLSRQFA